MKIERNNIYNMDCLEGMRAIPDGSVDCIICDLPYGTMKGAALNGWVGKSDQCEWDTIIPTDQLFEQYERVLRRGGTAVLFSQEPYTSHLRTFKARNMEFCQPCIWLKDIVGNPLTAKKACLNYFEDINIFTKIADSAKLNPLREYAKVICDYLCKTDTSIKNELRDAGYKNVLGVHHFLGYKSEDYRLCCEDGYNAIVDFYKIDNEPWFIPYSELRKTQDEFNKEFARVFNLPTGAASLSNVFRFRKDTDTFHPTQKPVGLIQRLVLTYSNPGDLILDNCMGSGTTAIACIREKRDFIGFEMNKEYYDKSLKRMQLERMQPTFDFGS